MESNVEILERLARIEGKLDAVHKVMFGNGRIGICDRVTIVEQRQDGCPARKWAQPSIIVALGSMIVAAVALIRGF